LLRLKNLHDKSKNSATETGAGSQSVHDKDFTVGTYTVNEIRLLNMSHTVDQIDSKLTAKKEVKKLSQDSQKTEILIDSDEEIESSQYENAREIDELAEDMPFDENSKFKRPAQ